MMASLYPQTSPVSFFTPPPIASPSSFSVLEGGDPGAEEVRHHPDLALQGADEGHQPLADAWIGLAEDGGGLAWFGQESFLVSYV